MKIESLLQNPELPSLPESVIRLLELISNDAALGEIADTINTDTSLTARTLELANSAWYKRERTIADVASAIPIIGIGTLYQIVFSSSVTRIFQGISTDLVNMNIFWKQCVRLAVAAQLLANRIHHPAPVYLYTAGLMTYIGKLVLYTTAPEVAQTILERSKMESLPHHKAELDALGFSHCDISAELLKKWQLPQLLYEPIRYYTNPLNAPDEFREAATILYIGHYLQYTFADDIGLTDPLAKMDPQILLLLNIDEEKGLSYIARETRQIVENTIAMLKL